MSFDDIGLRVKRIRLANSLTQVDFAERLGITRSALSQIEAGKFRPSLETLAKLVGLGLAEYGYLIEGAGTSGKNVPQNVPYDVPENVPFKSSQAYNQPETQEHSTNEPQAPYGSGKAALPLAILVDRHDKENIVVVPAAASAGYPSNRLETTYLSDLPRMAVPFLDGKSYRAFQLIGDSMNPDFRDGDYVICSFVEAENVIKKRVRLQMPYIVVNHIDVLFKRIADISEQGLLLSSDNKYVRDFTLPWQEVQEVWFYEAVISRRGREPSESALQRIVDQLTENMRLLGQSLTQARDQ